MANTQAAQAVADTTTTDRSSNDSIDNNHATQAVCDHITEGQTPILNPAPPHTPGLQPTQEPNAKIDALVLDSPLSSAHSVPQPPHFEAHSPFSSPGPSTGPVTSTGLPQDSETQEEHAEPQPEDEPQKDRQHPDGQDTDQEQPESAVAGPSTGVGKRNTTQEARTKAEKIVAGGAGVPHANGPCQKCIKGNHVCLVNPAVSGGNTCAKCAQHKEKCSHQLREDGHFVRANGRRAARPCNNCTKRTKQGLPAECFQAGTLHSKKLGTACSGCMIHGTSDTCSLKTKKAYVRRART